MRITHIIQVALFTVLGLILLADCATPPTAQDAPISYIAVTNVTSTGATIAWITAKPCPSVLYLGADPDCGDLGYLFAEPTTHHAIALDGLDPSTTYYFTIAAPRAPHTEIRTPANTIITPPAY